MGEWGREERIDENKTTKERLKDREGMLSLTVKAELISTKSCI